MDKGDPGWRAIAFRAPETTKLELTHCSLNLTSRAFYSMDLRLESLVITGAKYLFLTKESFLFPSSPNLSTKVVLDRIGFAVRLPKEVFGTTVNNLTVVDAKLVQFSSEAFHGMDASSDVTIVNSQVYPIKTSGVTETTPIQSLTLRNVKFDFVGQTFMKISVAKGVEFQNVELDLLTTDAIVITDAASIVFENCQLVLHRSMAISATSNKVSFINTTLMEPQRQSLMGFVGMNASSTLIMHDIILDDPARGTLLTKFPHVEYKNIVVDRCKCQLIAELLEDQDSFATRLTPTLTKEELMELLRNETFCYPKGKHFPGDSPISPPDCETYDYSGVIIGILFCMLLLGFLILAGCFYGWHRKIRDKYNAVKRWSFVVPTTVKESTVQFDEEVQYISRPNSTVFAINGNYAYALTNVRDSAIYQQPDLVKSSTVPEEGIYQEISDNVVLRPNKPRKIRKKSVYVRPALSNDYNSVVTIDGVHSNIYNSIIDPESRTSSDDQK